MHWIMWRRGGTWIGKVQSPSVKKSPQCFLYLRGLQFVKILKKRPVVFAGKSFVIQTSYGRYVIRFERVNMSKKKTSILIAWE